MDVKTAFLHGDLEEQIYMEQSNGFTQPGHEHLNGYKWCECDCCVYVKSFDDGSSIFLLLYVDDLLIAAKNIDRGSRKLWLSQRGYVEKVLDKFGMSKAKLVSYASAVGCLMSVMVCTRPNLAHVVSQVCKYMFKPGGGSICWKSTVQSIVALSTIEAEYMAVAEAAKEALWLSGLSKNLMLSKVEFSCIVTVKV
ncbi:UNVERIFIED_CONTAM: Retrovirus-related Pol polyprotein from transposon TNT 1-94 [Sesamum calycinum]|uniref:Retrovirus-related Pol polyprotein from transposon TNT 1-94 n=1 Tax=Sesamum calycinum TaxID=2727403 RepID=A0AAW2K1U7_9LAMI